MPLRRRRLPTPLARRRLRAGLVCLIAAVAVLLAAPASHATGLGDVTLSHAGRWITEPDGRVVILHGVNMPSKTGATFPAALKFGADDAELLNRLGLNSVRLTVERYTVEPSPGRFDDRLIARFADTVRMLAAHGIVSLIDFHQDEYGPTFFDNGFPAWMTQTDGLPNLFEVGFPGQYLANPAVNRAFDHLWANSPDAAGHGLQNDDAGLLAHVATQLRDLPGLLGYELINEPWPGSHYPACLNLATGCPGFDRGAYSNYYRHTLPAVRAADHRHLIFYEPLVTFNYGIPTHVAPPADPRRGFAFHDYPGCSAADDAGLPISIGQSCSAESGLTIAHAVKQATGHGDALLETEFGATYNTRTVSGQLAAYDRHMIPWMWWAYTNRVVHLARDGTLQPATDANLEKPMVATLTRPYPEIVAGTPTGWSFDPAKKTFFAGWSTGRAGGPGRFRGGALSQIVVPAPVYGGHYEVRLQGARVLSAPGAPLLQVAQDRSARSVSVEVSAAP